MIKNIFLLFIFTIFISACQRTEIVKTHGIAYLDMREKLIIINKSNKNDVVNVLGQPSTKGMTDNNLWIYIERTNTRSSLLKMGKSYTKKNNVLILEFDKYGILFKKEFLNKEKMNKLTFSKDITENEIMKENFIYSFLASVRQKMINKRK